MWLCIKQLKWQHLSDFMHLFSTRKQLNCLNRVFKTMPYNNTLMPLSNSVLKGKFSYSILYKLCVEEVIASDNKVVVLSFLCCSSLLSLLLKRNSFRASTGLYSLVCPCSNRSRTKTGSWHFCFCCLHLCMLQFLPWILSKLEHFLH